MNHEHCRKLSSRQGKPGSLYQLNEASLEQGATASARLGVLESGLAPAGSYDLAV